MTSDSGNLSIDFLAGFTIFLLAFIWVVSMIPGLLIGLQSYTIDYDAVAYRTGVILVEDPGEPALPQVPWELNDKRDVVRMGLAISKETPNILSQDKVNRFFCSTVFSYPDDYQKRAIFGDYPYRFNISLLDIEKNTTLYVGDSMSGSYGTIRRLVQIKGASNATIDRTYIENHHYNNTYYDTSGDNTTQHEFTILINNTKLLNDKVRNPAYQINPSREFLIVNITDINSTLYADREKCFNISLTKIYAKDENLIPIHLFNDPVIDGVPYHDINTESMYATQLPFVNNNISLILDPTFLPWSNYPQVYINLTFNLVKNTSECSGPAYNFSGSQFLNNTFTAPFDYNYHPDNVTQPGLRNAVMEVQTGSGSRTQTGTLIEQLIANFKHDLTGGTTVKFTDLSTGSPVEWKWEFGDGNTSTMSDPTYTYPGPGTYTVLLTVKDTDGNSNGPVSKSVVILAPVAGFSGSPLVGAAPLSVSFTDSSTNTPTSWNWEYKETTAGSWATFASVKNPSYSFPSGTYDIRLTATNVIGSNTTEKIAYITAIPLPVASFNANQTSGVTSLPVNFTDTSVNNPNSWIWEYNETTAGVWTQFSTAQHPTTTFPVGVYDIRLTVANTTIVGSDTMTKLGYITVTTVPISHTITASAGGGGTITPSGAIVVNEGGTQTFTITPNTGFSTASVLVDGIAQVPVPGSYTFTSVNADHSISATFAANTPVVIFYDNFNAGFSGWTNGGTPGTPDWYAGIM